MVVVVVVVVVVVDQLVIVLVSIRTYARLRNVLDLLVIASTMVARFALWATAATSLLQGGVLAANDPDAQCEFSLRFFWVRFL